MSAHITFEGGTCYWVTNEDGTRLAGPFGYRGAAESALAEIMLGAPSQRDAARLLRWRLTGVIVTPPVSLRVRAREV